MRNETIYDIAGIGIGPFNLGLAALCQPIENLKTIFIDQKPVFDWHGGLMIAGTTLQVSYLADLVTLADPSSDYSYLNFLRNQNRLLQFGIHEKSYITRSEYNRYCNWVGGRLNNLLFGSCVKSITYNNDDDRFEIKIKNIGAGKTEMLLAKHIVVGIGSKPYVPQNLSSYLCENIIHSSAYSYYKKDALKSEKITVIGSGQSAAEIFYDLLDNVDLAATRLNWLTRSDRFYAMEHSKLNYEMTSPDYINFFYSLDPDMKEQLFRQQFTLYKGINYELINAIYDRLYERFINGHQCQVTIRTHSELKNILKGPANQYALCFYHNALKKNFGLISDFVFLATGYQYVFPHFLKPVKNLIRLDNAGRFSVNRNYSVDDNNRIFVQNAEMHTHGFNAPDLGLGAYRNAVIINSVMQQKVYPVDEQTCFQCFDIAV
ncbi:MAG: SidA/IucD/PvdA family monooxygenase [Niabella sp.]